MGEDDLRKTWKENLEALYNVDTKERVTVNLCIDEIEGNYLEESQQVRMK